MGQLIEWLVWIEISLQAPGAFHVFLPRDDRGVDAVLKHLPTGSRLALQVKGRTTLDRGFATITGPAEAFNDDDAHLIVVVLDESARRLHPWAAVCDMPTFRRLAASHVVGGSRRYEAAIPLPARGRGRWTPHVVPVDEIASRLMSSVAVPSERRSMRSFAGEWGRRIGYLAETEVARLLAAAPELNLFAAAPDIETDEYVVRHVDSHAMIGLQVKATSVDPTIRSGISPQGAAASIPHLPPGFLASLNCVAGAISTTNAFSSRRRTSRASHRTVGTSSSFRSILGPPTQPTSTPSGWSATRCPPASAPCSAQSGHLTWSRRRRARVATPGTTPAPTTSS